MADTLSRARWPPGAVAGRGLRAPHVLLVVLRAEQQPKLSSRLLELPPWAPHWAVVSSGQAASSCGGVAEYPCRSPRTGWLTVPAGCGAPANEDEPSVSAASLPFASSTGAASRVRELADGGRSDALLGVGAMHCCHCCCCCCCRRLAATRLARLVAETRASAVSCRLLCTSEVAYPHTVGWKGVYICCCLSSSSMPRKPSPLLALRTPMPLLVPLKASSGPDSSLRWCSALNGMARAAASGLHA